MAWRNKFKIAAWLVACTILAAMFAESRPSTYSAAIKILLEPRGRVVRSVGETPGPIVLDLQRVDTEIQVVRSERLLSTVFNSLDLINHRDFRSPPGRLERLSIWFDNRLVQFGIRKPSDAQTTKPSSGNEADKDRHWREAFARFAQRLNARRVGESFVIEISFTSSDESLPTRVANATASAYLYQAVAIKAAAAKDGLEIVRGRLNELSNQLEAAKAAMKIGRLPDNPMPDADARVIGIALQPLGAVGPGKSLYIALGGILGLMTAFFGLVTYDALAGTVASARDVSVATGLPCLAILPRTPKNLRHGAAGLENLIGSRAAEGFSSGLRALRVHLTNSRGISKSYGEHSVFAVLPADSGSDSALIVESLAYLLHRSGRDVTVVSGRQRPQFHRGDQDTEAADSVADLLSVDGDPTMVPVSMNNGVRRVEIYSSNPNANLFVDFTHPTVTHILRQAASHGEVLLDLPPSSELPEVDFLAAQADAVVVLVQEARTRRDTLKQVRASLERVGANVIGVALNKTS